MRVIVDNSETLELLQEEFNEFLMENQILNEGKILNKIRWKLALFSLRFLREKSLNDFLIAYYADKNGKATDEGKNWVQRSKSEKLQKMRKLANQLDDETKQKIMNQKEGANSEHFSKKMGILQATTAGIGAASGIGSYITPKIGKRAIDNAMNHVPINNDSDSHVFDAVNNIPNGGDSLAFVSDHTSQISNNHNTHIDTFDDYTNSIDFFKNMCGLSNILYKVMWGALILAGATLITGIVAMHNASVKTRNEILDELRNKKKLEESYTDFELYQILDENGYVTDNESLQILKEGIIAGDFVID